MRVSLAFLLVPLAAVAQSATIEVTLRAQNAVSGAYFRLQDIAIVRADDQALERELGELRIGRSPRAGTTLAVKAGDVERALARLKPALAKRLQVAAVPDAVVRRGPLQTIEPARLRDAAAQALRQFLAERSTRFEIEPSRDTAQAIVLPEGSVELRPRLASAGPIPTRLSVWVDIYVDGSHYQSLPMFFSVRAYRPVLVARSALRAGRPLRAADVSAREEQIAGYADSPLPAETDVTALQLKRPLASDEVLTWRHVRQAPAVARDQDVIVRLTIGAIELETGAVALQEARAGEVIRVRSLSSARIFSARVTGPGTVQALWR